MTPTLCHLSGLSAALEDFAARRDWLRFQSPKNLAMALTGEVGELVEHFQWLTEDESRQLADDPARKRAVSEEMADVLMYLVRMADMMGIDLDEACRHKLVLNERKHPAPEGR